jgi:hypothetical protein
VEGCALAPSPPSSCTSSVAPTPAGRVDATAHGRSGVGSGLSRGGARGGGSGGWCWRGGGDGQWLSEWGGWGAEVVDDGAGDGGGVCSASKE